MPKLIRYWKMLFVPMSVIFISAIFIGAYFSSSVSSSGNTFSTGSWVTPIVAGDVVINELMWMGSVEGVINHTSDEWIELRNTKNYPIDISGWQLTRKSSGAEGLMLTIPNGKSIAANGFFLISNYVKSSSSSQLNADSDLVDADVNLANSALQIKLYKGDWSNVAGLIDIADDGVGVPLAGVNLTGEKRSMSRNTTSGDGTQATSWHTDTTSNGLIYWKAVNGNYGTPGGSNV